MPDTIISNTVITSIATTPQPCSPRLRSAAEMRALWTAFKAASDAYDENNETSVKAFSAANDAFFDARTSDPAANGLKLKAMRDMGAYYGDMIAEVAEDLMRPASSPLEFARTLIATAAPYADKNGKISSREEMHRALTPLIGHYNIADAVALTALLHGVDGLLAAESDEQMDGAFFGLITILEEFACRADPADIASVTARAVLIGKATGDEWVLGDADLEAATRNARTDIRKVSRGDFRSSDLRTTFAVDGVEPGWLACAIDDAEKP